MSSGPIEFLSETGELHEVPTSEYGGADGLIQPGPDQVGLKAKVDGMPIGHELTGAEANNVMTRDGMRPMEGAAQATGEDTSDGIVRDPITGREVDAEQNVDVTGKPGREHGLRDLLL